MTKRVAMMMLALFLIPAALVAWAVSVFSALLVLYRMFDWAVGIAFTYHWGPGPVLPTWALIGTAIFLATGPSSLKRWAEWRSQ